MAYTIHENLQRYHWNVTENLRRKIENFNLSTKMDFPIGRVAGFLGRQNTENAIFVVLF